MEFNSNGTSGQPQKSGWFGSVIWLLVILGMTAALMYSLKVDTKVTNVDYYEVVSYFDEGKVTEYSLNLSSRELTYVLEGEKEKRKYTVPNVTIFLEDVHKEVREFNKENPDKAIKMNYDAGASTSWIVQILPMTIGLILMFAFFWWFSKKMGNNIMMENNRTMAFGKARLKSGDDEERKTTFDDVAGVDEEKEDLQEIVEFLRAPEKFNDLGARIPKGVLLVGPPGTGKTLLARAVAGEANATFLSISGSDFVEMYVGVGASRVRDLFETAKKNVPAIIFIDEIDAVGRHRGAGMGGGHDEREQTLNQLLVEMDGFGANTGVIIIAATNRPDILDPALLRPGRFDRQVTVNYPDVSGREAILKVHAKNKPLGPDVSLPEVARATSGFTGADLENLLNEAALLAARRDKRAITKGEIEEATIKVVVGTEKKSKKVNDKEKKLTAYHEAGHAVTNYYLDSLDPVHQISIIPRGMAGGYTMSLPKEDKSYVSKQHMLDELVTLLGGRVAEAIILGDVSTGASNDIERATNIARNMITKYGMSDNLGPIAYGSDNNEVFLGKNYNHVRNYSEDTAAAIDREISAVIGDAYDKAHEILRLHIDKLHLLAEFLMKYEKIDGFVFYKLMDNADFTIEEYEAHKEEYEKEAALTKAAELLAVSEEEKVSDEAQVEGESVEEVPVEEVPVEEAPAEEVPAEEVPAEEVPAEEVLAEETPVEETTAEETPTEEATVEETQTKEEKAPKKKKQSKKNSKKKEIAEENESSSDDALFALFKDSESDESEKTDESDNPKDE